jgi:hypothetical protein
VPTATLAYQYGTRAAWLEDLTAESLPSTYDLCTQHADGVSVPVGWRLDDRRTPGGHLRWVPVAV